MGELTGGKRPAVEEGGEDGGSGPVGEQGGHLGDIRIHISMLRALSMADAVVMSSDQSAFSPSSRPSEVTAFLDSLHDVPPGALSACTGWMAHEVTAHLAAGAAEVSRHLGPFLAGDQVPATRGFDEREAPFRFMADPDLRRRLDAEEERMRMFVDAVLAADPATVVPWTGREMPVAKFIPHLRSELAIHRWDIVGNSDELLGQPELTVHAVQVLGPLLLRRGLQRSKDDAQPLAARLRCPGQPDLRITAAGAQATITLVDPDDDEEPWLDGDPAARLLTIWGRRPHRSTRLVSHMDSDTLARLQNLLAGY